jgi:hypothetical protein
MHGIGADKQEIRSGGLDPEGRVAKYFSGPIPVAGLLKLKRK